MQQEYHLRLGILVMVLSSFGFSAMQLTVALSRSTIPLMQQVFFRNVICLLIGLIFCRIRRVPCLGTAKQQPYLFGRSLSGMLGVICLFAASAGARQADVSILSKLNPFFVALFAAVFLHEQVTRRQVSALFLAFAGAFLVCNPTMNSNPGPLGLALLNAFFSGIAYILLSYMNGRADPFTIISHFSLVSCTSAGIWLLLTNSMVRPSSRDWLMLLLIGLFSALGQVCITFAYRLAPASQISILDYTGILFSLLLGWFFLGESVPATSLAGAVLVILGAWVSLGTRHNRQRT
ncbi:MAG: EamA/RhaT family transporter [Oscillospiraceae bacterium]|nr:MAG: EamA/RhaT family transporter [Oscillospiraceae bacterium]